ncbi:MAG: protein kinase, partial [Nitrospirae bacterium]|nr:protein kinase [Nitrospirota bacterium]
RILEDGTAKILDFGVAMLQHSDTRLTAAGTTMGTAAYLAPEQIRGEKVDGRTDIFSFGVLAYELVTGERPFGQETISAILYEILNDDPRPITLPSSVCPEGLRHLVFRCLEKDPDRRYSDCGEIIEALEAVRESLKTDPRPRDLTSALRKSSSPPLPGPSTGGEDPRATPPQSSREDETFDPLIQHEWTPSGIAIPKQRAPIQRLLIYALALLTIGGAYAWLGALGLVPWPEARSHQEPSAAVMAPVEPSNNATIPGEDNTSTSTRVPGDQQAGGDSSVQVQEALEPLQQDPTATVEDPGATSLETPPAVSELQAEPEPEPAAPLVVEATLTVAASWHPETTVTIDNGRPMKLSKGRSLELQPGDHKAVFALSTPDYSSRQTVRLRLESGERRTLRSPIQRPGHLTVQASLGSPQGLVAVDGNLVGSSPLRGQKLSPGSHRLELYPLEGATAPLASVSLEIQTREETVVTFDLTGRQELSVRSRPESH